MYSIVLMAAMTTGGDVAACHGGGGCGCGGGHGFCGGLFRGCGCGGGGFCGGCFNRHSCGCCGYTVSCGCCGQVACGCGGYVQSCGCCGNVCDGCSTGTAVEEKKDKDDEEKMDDKEGRLNAPAKLIVSIPAGAKLTINDAATKSTSARRVFVSPTLNAGKTYVYTLTAKIDVDGKTVTVSKKVDVRAGKTSTVSLNTEAAAVASR